MIILHLSEERRLLTRIGSWERGRLGGKKVWCAGKRDKEMSWGILTTLYWRRKKHIVAAIEMKYGVDSPGYEKEYVF